MRKFTLIVTVIVLLANAGWVAKTHAQWQTTTTKDTRWTVEMGGKAYDRPGSELGLPLITDGPTGATLFDSNQATDLGTAGGAEVKFSWVTRNDRELEFRSILAFWDQSHLVEGTDLRSPFFPAPPAPTTVGYDYESNYFSFELMSRHAVSPGVTVMFGPRIVSTMDQTTLFGSLTVDPGDGTPAVDFIETRITQATNILLGLQGGLEFNIPVGRSIHINSFIRVGGYTNPTQVTGTTSDNFSIVPPITSRETKSTGSFLGEVGGRVYADIVPNCFSTYVGYEATWIDGIALAPVQLLTTGATGVQTANTPFFNAAVFGLQWGY